MSRYNVDRFACECCGDRFEAFLSAMDLSNLFCSAVFSRARIETICSRVSIVGRNVIEDETVLVVDPRAAWRTHCATGRGVAKCELQMIHCWLHVQTNMRGLLHGIVSAQIETGRIREHTDILIRTVRVITGALLRKTVQRLMCLMPERGILCAGFQEQKVSVWMKDIKAQLLFDMEACNTRIFLKKNL